VQPVHICCRGAAVDRVVGRLDSGDGAGSCGGGRGVRRSAQRHCRPGPADHGVKTGCRGPCCVVLHVYIYPCIVLCKTCPIQ
jgi:hypothetical protein